MKTTLTYEPAISNRPNENLIINAYISSINNMVKDIVIAFKYKWDDQKFRRV